MNTTSLRASAFLNDAEAPDLAYKAASGNKQALADLEKQAQFKLTAAQ